MKTPLAFLILAIFSLLLLCSTADGKKYPEKYWGKGINLRMQLVAREKISDEFDDWTVDQGDEAEEEAGLVGTSSEPVGSGGGGDPKEEKPDGTASKPVDSGDGCVVIFKRREVSCK